jgi:hypothetical protein
MKNFRVVLAQPTVMIVSAEDADQAHDKAMEGRDKSWEVLGVEREAQAGDRVRVIWSGTEHHGEVVGVVPVNIALVRGEMISRPNAEEPLKDSDAPADAERLQVHAPKIRLDGGQVVYGCQVWWTYADECHECGICEDHPLTPPSGVN